MWRAIQSVVAKFPSRMCRLSRVSAMSKIQLACVVALAIPVLSACAGSGGGDLGGIAGGASAVVGDENGGKIPNALGSRTEQTAAYQTVNTHCEKFGKKGIITKMDYDSGSVTFECRLLKGKTTS
jgi:hypothetical protein